MANRIANPSFEIESPDPWAYENNAARSDDRATDGAWSGRVPSIATLVPGAEGGKASQSFTFAAIEKYTLTARVWVDSQPSPARTLTFTVEQGGDDVVALVVSTDDLTPNDWNDVETPLFVPQIGAATLTIEGSVYVGFGALVNFYVDEVVVEEAQMVTKTLRGALLLDLQSISGIVTTDKNPLDLKEAFERAPFAFISEAGSGEASPETLSNMRGEAVQTFTVVMGVKTRTDTLDALDDLLDDLRNSVERDAGNLRAAVIANGGVEIVIVANWSDVNPGETIGEGRLFRTATVTAQYLYERGAV